MSDQDTVTPNDNFSFVDDVPEKGNPIPSSDYQCVVCGTDLVYSGRGRKPKYCDEHKPSRSKVTSTATKRVSGAIVERAITEIAAVYSGIALPLKFVSPIASTVVYDNADKLAESYRLLLETSAKFRKLFMELESKAAWLPILTMHGEIIANIWIATAMNKATNRVEDYVNGEGV